MVKEKQKRIKEGKFKSEEERLMFENFAKRKPGTYLDVFVGLKKTYKRELPDSFWTTKSKLVLKNTEKGYKLLEKKKLPVTKFYGKKTIRGEERLVFEKARKIKKEEWPKHINEVLKIMEEAQKKKIFFDASEQNFGITKEGKVVIIDTNMVQRRRSTPEFFGLLIGTLMEKEVDNKVLRKIENTKTYEKFLKKNKLKKYF